MTLYSDRYNHLRLVSGVTAYIDKLAENEDELLIDLERLNAEREEKLTREQLLSDRGVGIRAFEWRHLQKNLGLEYWLGNILAIRIGYKIEPGINLPQTDWFLSLPDWININNLTGGIGVKIHMFNLDLSYGPSFGPTLERLIEVTGMIAF